MRQSLISEHFAQVKIENEGNLLKCKIGETIKRSYGHSVGSLQKSLNFSRVLESSYCLSQKTLRLIQSLDCENVTRFDLEADSILNGISAREKYQDLLKSSTKSLTLPYKYKKLLKSLKLIDHTINNSRLYKISLNFQKLKQVIWMTHSQSIELDEIQKINFLIPNFFSLSWSNESLQIDLPESGHLPKFIIHSRYSRLKQELLERVKVIHSAFLNSQKIKFDPDASKTWHSSFNLHNVPDVPSAPLPEKNETENRSKSEIGKQLRATRLIVLCRMIIKIFNDTQTPSLFLKSLVKNIQKEKWNLEDPKNIENDLREIQELFGFWISFIDTESGKVVRVNKQSEFCFQSARDQIKSRYKS
jgi:hypothetical protein